MSNMYEAGGACSVGSALIYRRAKKDGGEPGISGFATARERCMYFRPQVERRRPVAVPSRCLKSDSPDYMLLFNEVHLATTLVPTAPMTAIAATTIKPAIRA